MTAMAISRPACNTPAGYEPPIASNLGGYWLPPFEDIYQLADGVDGWAIERNGRVEIRIVHSPNPGNGAVGRMIDSLSPRCVFSCVVNVTLANMLMRRGWRTVMEAPAESPTDHVDIWLHPEAK